MVFNMLLTYDGFFIMLTMVSSSWRDASVIFKFLGRVGFYGFRFRIGLLVGFLGRIGFWFLWFSFLGLDCWLVF
jgi:hypothetical protein